MYLHLWLKAAKPYIFKCRAGFSVFTIRLCVAKIKPGNTVNTQNKLMTTPLANTIPRSKPILKLIKTISNEFWKRQIFWAQIKSVCSAFSPFKE